MSMEIKLSELESLGIVETFPASEGVKVMDGIVKVLTGTYVPLPEGRLEVNFKFLDAYRVHAHADYREPKGYSFAEADAWLYFHGMTILVEDFDVRGRTCAEREYSVSFRKYSAPRVWLDPSDVHKLGGGYFEEEVKKWVKDFNAICDRKEENYENR